VKLDIYTLLPNKKTICRLEPKLEKDGDRLVLVIAGPVAYYVGDIMRPRDFSPEKGPNGLPIDPDDFCIDAAGRNFNCDQSVYISFRQAREIASELVKQEKERELECKKQEEVWHAERKCIMCGKELSLFDRIAGHDKCKEHKGN